MLDYEPLENQDVKRLRSLMYLIPIVGFLPAVWTLYYRKGDRQQQNLSRLAVTLTLGWLAGYVLLGGGAQVAEGAELPLLIASSLLTSGYFGLNIWLMARVLRGKPVRLPIVSRVGDRLP
jgi:hypothetical protein